MGYSDGFPDLKQTKVLIDLQHSMRLALISRNLTVKWLYQSIRAQYSPVELYFDFALVLGI